MNDARSPANVFASLVETMHTLRAPGGCPWDAEQTHESLESYLIEEAYEMLDAIARKDDEDLCDELGDVLLQVVFHAELAAEREAFTIVDVIEAIQRKLVRRHPHVFAGVVVASSEEVAKNWQRIKREEIAKKKNSSHSSAAELLAAVPRRMPGLIRAQRIGSKAASAGFDWNNPEDVLSKVREELDEVAEAIELGDSRRVADEVGDLLFAAANLGRKLGLKPETVVHGALDRFVARFASMERALLESGRRLEEATADELDQCWEAVKRRAAGDAALSDEPGDSGS